MGTSQAEHDKKRNTKNSYGNGAGVRENGNISKVWSNNDDAMVELGSNEGNFRGGGVPLSTQPGKRITKPAGLTKPKKENSTPTFLNDDSSELEEQHTRSHVDSENIIAEEDFASEDVENDEEPVIVFSDVHKEYLIKGKNTVSALKGVSFSIQPGEFVFLVGPSGSGKSTVLRLIIREEDTTSGDIVVGKVNLKTLERRKVPSLRRQVGTVFQDFRLLNDRTVGENVEFTLKVLGETSGVDKKVIDTLALVGLADKVDRYPHELSGGEQQRAAIARAFVTDPPLLVADEPTGNLDPETSEDIMSLLNMINLSGTTVLMATHDANIVNSMNKRVIRLNDGNVVSDEERGTY